MVTVDSINAQRKALKIRLGLDEIKVSTFSIRGYINSIIIFLGYGWVSGYGSALRQDQCIAIIRRILESNPYFHPYNAIKKFLNLSIISLTFFYKSGILFFKDGDGKASLFFLSSFFPQKS